MKITFLGTRGFIEEYSKKHYYHSSLLLTHKNFRLLIDHGLISRKLSKIKPNTILITHAHPDTFKWVKEDESYKGKIYVTEETKKLAKYRKNFKIIKLNAVSKLGPFKILAYRVIHSINAPAVGYKIKGDKTIIYNPDLVIPKNKAILKQIDLYVGDGSSFKANLVRRKNRKLFGHARMTAQINWCKKYNIKNIIFTHIGKEPLRIGDKILEKKLSSQKIKVKIAHDGMELKI